MNIVDFNKIFDLENKNDPFLFKDEKVKVTNIDIQVAEKKIKVIFPHSYKEFVKFYGGGNIGYTNIFTPNSKNEFYIVTKNLEFQKTFNNHDFITISDDGTGGFYGYMIQNLKCSESIYYFDHDENKISKKLYNNIYEYIIEIGLNL